MCRGLDLKYCRVSLTARGSDSAEKMQPLMPNVSGRELRKGRMPDEQIEYGGSV